MLPQLYLIPVVYIVKVPLITYDTPSPGEYFALDELAESD